MHIPNGFLDPKTSAGAAFAAAAVLGYCFAKVRQALAHAVPESILAGAGQMAANISESSKKMISTFTENHIMKMGAVASLIFAGQMFNFTIAQGTSGHLLGGILAALAVGPFSGALVISAILTIQTLFFADGGILALGANILNMGVLGTLVTYYIYYFINRSIKNYAGYYVGVFISSLFSVLLAATACSIEIAFSGTAALSDILSSMLNVHFRIGIAEGLITIMCIEIMKKYCFEFDGIVKDE